MLKLSIVNVVFFKLIVNCMTLGRQDCYKLMSSGHCDYYKCFNEKHRSCQLDFGFEYCDRFQHHLESMSNEGKQWLNVSRICVMEQMWELGSDMRCSSIEQNLKDVHERCEVEAGLCTGILWNDRNTFSDVNNLRSGTVYFKHALRRCPVDVLRRFVSWVKESGAAEWLESVKDEITNAIDGILEYFE